MNNRAFWRAINALAHPIAIIAIILLVLNDHLLKAQYASWWTGKLSDVAGLIFVPLLLAALMALVAPQQWPRRDTWIIGVALILTGSIFALAMTWPERKPPAERSHLESERDLNAQEMDHITTIASNLDDDADSHRPGTRPTGNAPDDH